MASILRPRRGKKSTAISQNIILKRGEVFFEVPDSGVGTGSGRIKVGDGTTEYGSLPYFINDSNKVVVSQWLANGVSLANLTGGSWSTSPNNIPAEGLPQSLNVYGRLFILKSENDNASNNTYPIIMYMDVNAGLAFWSHTSSKWIVYYNADQINLMNNYEYNSFWLNNLGAVMNIVGNVYFSVRGVDADGQILVDVYLDGKVVSEYTGDNGTSLAWIDLNPILDKLNEALGSDQVHYNLAYVVNERANLRYYPNYLNGLDVVDGSIITVTENNIGFGPSILFSKTDNKLTLGRTLYNQEENNYYHAPLHVSDIPSGIFGIHMIMVLSKGGN